jgi:hypothetical protein
LTKYLIRSRAAKGWWRENASGYTYDVAEAGLYTADQVHHYFHGGTADRRDEALTLEQVTADLDATIKAHRSKITQAVNVRRALLGLKPFNPALLEPFDENVAHIFADALNEVRDGDRWDLPRLIELMDVFKEVHCYG